MDTLYSRDNPSPRYRAMADMYKQMHEVGETSHGIPPEQTFDGRSLAPHAGTVRGLIAKTGAETLLDYGAGKGGLYQARNLRDPEGKVYPDIRSFWGLSAITLYDPGYAPYSAYPTGRFDAVICTDVLEHIPEEDIPWILGELMGFAEKFVFVTIAGYPAGKTLPNGENAHCTLKPVEWWTSRLTEAHAACAKSALRWFALYIDYDSATKKQRQFPLQG